VSSYWSEQHYGGGIIALQPLKINLKDVFWVK